MKKFILSIMLFFCLITNVYAVEGVTAIKIDDKPLEGFNADKLDYAFEVDSNKDSIKIGCDFDHDVYGPNIMGSFGTVKLNYGLNELKFTLKRLSDKKEVQYNINVTRKDSRDADNSLSELIVGSSKVILSDANTYDVLVDSKLTSVEVKATINSSKSSFVTGYGERTGNNKVNLSGETTTIEVKVKAENENVRTYTINIKKSDYKNNDATLKSLTIDGIDFDFKSNTFEYDLIVKYEIQKITINAVANDEKATLDYKNTEVLKLGINTIEIRVLAEDSSSKTYKLNITREEEVPLVTDIKIEGIDFEFNPKTYNYKIETELDKLEFNVTLKDENVSMETLNNENLKNNSVVKIEASENDNKVTYSFRIVNKNSDDTETTEKEKNINEVNKDTVDNNNIKNNEMLISCIIFGVGVISLTIAIFMKSKSKKDSSQNM